jgi:glycosyltransferase involved in cell wall biosynthesis
MAEILLDITRLLDRGLQGRLPTGVDRVSLEYVRHYRDRARALVRFAGRWLTLGTSDSRRLFGKLVESADRFGWIVRACVASNYALNWTRGIGPGVLINTGHSGLEQPAYGRFLRRHGLRAVFFLHDLIPIDYPEYCRPGETERHQRRLATMLGEGSALVINSMSTFRALGIHAGRLGLTIPPNIVAPLAPGPLPPPGARPPLDAPYFVMVGTIEPRKNHLLILEVWRDLVRRMGHAVPHLVIIGQVGWECEAVLDLLERCEEIRPHVLHLQSCDDAELVTWLRHARALLFPSFAEGYGLPLVEALSLGVPAIVSEVPAFREIAATVPDYVSPIDGLGWRDAVIEYCGGDGARRAGQLARLRDFSVPTWQRHFSVVDELVERVADRPAQGAEA